MLREPITIEWWRATFEQLDECPWPGPRPLTANDDRHLLCGRDDEVSAFRREVDSHRLIFLTGRSGVGKTSLLRCGLIPELESEESGYKVALCREWSGSAAASDAALFLAGLIHRELGDPELPADRRLFRVLAEEYGESVVIVLDQFEELIRDAPSFKDQLFDVLVDINNLTPLKVVISFRSEHLHEVRPLEQRARPFSMFHYYLDEVDPAAARDVIMAADRGRETIIQSDAVDLLHKAWFDAGVGLLHLQALLYGLHDRARDQLITAERVAEFEAALRHQYADRTGGLFDAALEESVEVKLERCRKASYSLGLDAYLVEGATSVLSRLVRHLSSAGFKLVRDARDLAESTIGSDIEALTHGMQGTRSRSTAPPDGPASREQLQSLFDVVVRAVLMDVQDGGESDPAGRDDLLSAPRATFATAADAALPATAPLWASRLRDGESISPLDADPFEVTSGAMLGMPPAAVLIEELRRYAFALGWLQASSLVRLSAPGRDNVMVALIHDGFGAALERWSQQRLSKPGGPVHALTAPRGAEFVWRSPDGDSLGDVERLPTVEDSQLVLNVRWRGAWIDAPFRRAMFVNCDFRGTFFNRCRFEAVTFVNCLLDGAMFSDCTIVGRPSDPPSDYYEDPVSFHLPGSQHAASVVARYRGLTVADGATVISDAPGVPPSFSVDVGEISALRRLTPEPGALVVYGGRVSTLAARATRFEDGAKLCLRDTAGSGFDIVEHDSAGTYEVTGSSLRHVTFTSPPTEPVGGETLTVEILNSALFQMWIGHDISGSLVAVNSCLIQLWNGSPTFRGAVQKNSRYHGLVGNFDIDVSSTPLVQDERLRALKELDANGAIREDAIDMDYRRFPSLPQRATVSPSLTPTDVGSSPEINSKG